MTATKSTYISRGNQKYQIAKTQTFNIDNGSGTTVDDVVLYAASDLYLQDAYCVYTEATDTTGAATASVKMGITAGGNELVASTNLSAAKAVGAAVALTLARHFVPAGSSVFVRHTGRASTEAGQYYVQVRYAYKA